MSTEERVRLLICHTCRSCQELPEYDGPADYDHTLKYRIAEHQFGDGRPHRGIMPSVLKRDWDKPTYKDAILAKVAEEAGFTVPGTGVGMGDTFYALKNNFSEDAFACWKVHNRTTDCADWRSNNKRLIPDTKADRRAEGMASRSQDMPNTWLCDFCPVNSIIQQKVNKKRGHYDKQPWEQ